METRRVGRRKGRGGVDIDDKEIYLHFSPCCVRWRISVDVHRGYPAEKSGKRSALGAEGRRRIPWEMTTTTSALNKARLAVRIFYIDSTYDAASNEPMVRIMGQVYGSPKRTAVVHLRGAFPYILVPLEVETPDGTFT